jgi:hypothetical protein
MKQSHVKQKTKKIFKNVSLILHNRSGVNVTKLFALVLAKKTNRTSFIIFFQKKLFFKILFKISLILFNLLFKYNFKNREKVRTTKNYFAKNQKELRKLFFEILLKISLILFNLLLKYNFKNREKVRTTKNYFAKNQK